MEHAPSQPVALGLVAAENRFLARFCRDSCFRRTSGSTPGSPSNSASHWAIRNACVFQGVRGVALSMSRMRPECPGSDPPDRSVAADVLVREEPDEEEEDEEENEEDKDKEKDDDDGYSE